MENKSTKTKVYEYRDIETITLGSLRSFTDPRTYVYVHFTSKPEFDNEAIKKLDKEIDRRSEQICQFNDINVDYNDIEILFMYSRFVYHDHVIKPINVIILCLPEEDK